MIKKILIASIIFVQMAITGCASSRVWKSAPEKAVVENSSFSAELVPNCAGQQGVFLEFDGCMSFELSIKNKTNGNIELDWNKSLYVEGGQTSGGFMYDGIIYADRNKPKQSDVIFAGGSFTKTIWPNKLVFIFSDKWDHLKMPAGENGIYLTIAVDGKNINEKLTTKLIAEEGK
jgi:hypothetical protein